MRLPREGDYIAIYVPNPPDTESNEPYMIPLKILRVRNNGFERLEYGSLGVISAGDNIITKFPFTNTAVSYIPEHLKETILYNDDSNRVLIANAFIEPRYLLKLQFQSPISGESYYMYGDMTPISPDNAEDIGMGYTESPFTFAVLPYMNNWGLAVINFSNIDLKTYAVLYISDLEVIGVNNPYEIARILINNTYTYVNRIVFPGRTSPGKEALNKSKKLIDDFTIVRYASLKITTNINELANQIQNVLG